VLLGSYLFRTVAKPTLNVDLGIELPQGFVKRKDIINYRYLYKRAVYLNFLKKELKKEERFASVTWSWFRGDRRKPILIVRPKAIKGDKYYKIKTSFEIRIIPFFSNSTYIFKPQRMLPVKSNVKASKMLSEVQENSEEGGIEAVASPYYNSLLLEDCLYRSHQTLVHHYLLECSSLVDAILLFKVWLRQREMQFLERDSMNGFMISMLLVYLLQKRKLNKQMSDNGQRR